MKVEDLFENMRPVATVWKKRGNKIERGRISKFMVDLKALKDIEVRRGKEDQEEEPVGERSALPSGVSTESSEVAA
jgi:hypothetical protein